MQNQQTTPQANTICHFTVDQYIEKLTEYHGHLAPGLLVGGFMVDAAAKRMTEYEYFDALCETTSCLPDAIQILTPCTVGNGWLKIVNTGRFAITLYEKVSGDGVRVSIDMARLDRYPEIKSWFMKLLPKREQDTNALVNEIRAAGQDILALKTVRVSPALRGKRLRRIVLCESCGEAYPDNGSTQCPACQGMDIYV
jgi:formylmethanofuran dehydrogenase subunit E